MEGMAHLWMIYLVNMVIFAQFSIVVLNYQMVISCNFTLNPIKSPLIPSKLHDKEITIYHEVLFTYAGFSRLPPKTKDLDPGYRIRHVTEQELMEASGILRSSKVAGKSPIKMEVESWDIPESIRKWWAIPETSGGLEGKSL